MSLTQAISTFTVICLLVFFTNCRKIQSEMPGALSSKNAIVLYLGAEESTTADSLLGSLFPALAKDFRLLSHYGWADEREWLVGLQYIQQQGWLPTFVTPWEGKQSILDWNPTLSVQAYSTFRDVSLFQVEEELFAATTRGFLILGRLPLLVEDAIRELDGGKTNLGEDSSFRQQWKEKADVPRRIFLQPNEFLPQWPGPVWANYWLNHYQWVDISLQTVEGELLISGQVMPKENQLIQSISKGKKTELLPSFLPGNINMLHWTNTSTLKFQEPYYTCFQQWWDGGMTTFQIEGQPHPVFAFSTTELRLAQETLDNLANQQGIIGEETYQVFSIKQLLDDQMISYWWPEAIRNPYYAVIGDYVVFAASRSALTVCIDYYLTGRSSTRFSALMENLDEAAAHFSWFRPEVMLDVGVGITTLSWIEWPVKNQRQIQGSGQRALEQNTALSLWWKYPLKGKIVAGPAEIHDATGQLYAFLVQDEHGRLYCLDESGQLLWQKHLEGEVISDFKILHVRNQGRFFFNSRDKVYALDFYGNFLPPFPLDLPVPAGTGLQLINFDRVDEAALFIPTVDGAIYGFDQAGRLLAGWSPNRDMLPLRFPLVHLQENYQDLIFGINQADSVLIWNRGGEQAMTGWQMDTSCLSPLQLQAGRFPKKIIIIDAMGKGTLVSGNGQRTSLHFPGNMDQDIRWLYTDISREDRKEYVLFNDRQLAVYSDLGKAVKPLFTYEFPYLQDTVFAISGAVSTKSLIGMLNIQRQELCVLDGSGQLLPGFPVAADRSAIWGTKSMDQFVLVTGLDNDVVAYGW